MPNPLKPRKAPKQARSTHLVDSIIEATARVLADHGYAGTNTNLIAAQAGVSIGSLYQYFPNKEALIVAVHDRHIHQMAQVMDAILEGSRRVSLGDHVGAMVRAMLAAHLVEPRLHRVLEQEVPFVETAQTDGPGTPAIHDRVRRFLEDQRDAITPTDLDLAAWVVCQIVKSLVHAAVIAPPRHLAVPDIERGITEAILGYLTRPAAVAAA